MIIHIDMDAFFASIEQAINPHLLGKPLIVGSRPGKFRTVVCAASYEAKAFGIGSGMSSADAFKICPGLEFVPADQGKYIWTSEQIFAMLKELDFPIRYASIDEFQLDIGNLENPELLARTIQSRIQEAFRITASIGIAKNWLLSKLASKIHKPNGIAVITDENLENSLAKIPVNRLCGVGEKTALILDAIGVKTCLDLYQKSAHFLEEHLGQAGLDFYTGLRATDHFEPEPQETKPKSIGHSYTFPIASENTGFIQAWIRLLSEMVGSRLRQRNLISKTQHLWLNGPEIGNFGTQKTFDQATNDGYEIYRRSLKIMARTGPGTPKIRALGVTSGSLETANYAPLFNELKRREELIKTMDNINNRFGEGAVFPAIIYLSRKIK